jgi:hypothetical protein
MKHELMAACDPDNAPAPHPYHKGPGVVINVFAGEHPHPHPHGFDKAGKKGKPTAVKKH